MQDDKAIEEARAAASRLNELTAEIYALRKQFDELCKENGIDKRLVPVYDLPEKTGDWIARHGFTIRQYYASKETSPAEILKALYEKQSFLAENHLKKARKSKPFEIRGMVFQSVDDFAKKMGIQPNSVYSHAARDKSSALEACKKIYENRLSSGYIADGIRYNSKLALAKALGVRYSSLAKYLENHDRFAIDAEELRALDLQANPKPARRNGHEVSFDGYTWPSRTAFMKDMGFSSLVSLYSYARLHGITPEERMKEIYLGINRRNRKKGGGQEWKRKRP